MARAVLVAIGLAVAAPALAQTSPYAPVPSAPVGMGGSQRTQATGSPPDVGPIDNARRPGIGGRRGFPGENNPAYLVRPPARQTPVRIPRNP